MYIVENPQEAEKVANFLLQDVECVRVNNVQFHDVQSISISRQPDDHDNIVITINLSNGQHAIANYYEFEKKCHFVTQYSEYSALIIGINDLSAEKVQDKGV